MLPHNQVPRVQTYLMILCGFQRATVPSTSPPAMIPSGNPRDGWSAPHNPHDNLLNRSPAGADPASGSSPAEADSLDLLFPTPPGRLSGLPNPPKKSSGDTSVAACTGEECADRRPPEPDAADEPVVFEDRSNRKTSRQAEDENERSMAPAIVPRATYGVAGENAAVADRWTWQRAIVTRTASIPTDRLPHCVRFLILS